MTKQQAKKLAKDFRLGNRHRKANLMRQFNIKPATSSNTGRLKMGIRIDIENNPRDYIAALDDDGKLVFFSGNPIKRIPAIELFDTPKATKKESVNEVKTNKFTLNDMDDNDAAVVAAMAQRAGVYLRTRKISMKRSDVELKGDKKKIFRFINSLPESVNEKRFDMIYRLDDMDNNYAGVVTAMAKRAGLFLRKRNVSMNKSAVELKGDVKKIDKFIRSLPESVSEEAPSRVRDHLGGGYTLVYNSRTNRRIALDKLKKAGFKDSDFSGLSNEISIKKDAEVFKKAGVTDQKKQKEMVLKVLGESVNRLERLTGKKVTVTTPNDSITGKLVFNFGYLNRFEYFVDGYENEKFTARDVKSILGNKIKLTKDFDAMESTNENTVPRRLKSAPGSFGPAKYYYSLFPNRQDAVKALKKAGFEGFGDLTISQKDGTIKVNPNATAYRKQGIKLTDYKGQHKYVMSILDPNNTFRESVDRQLVVLETILKNEDVDLILQFNESHEFDIKNIKILEVRKLFKNFKESIEERTQYQLVAQKVDGTELRSKFYDEENMLADMQQKCEDSEDYESTSVIKRVVDTDEEEEEKKEQAPQLAQIAGSPGQDVGESVQLDEVRPRDAVLGTIAVGVGAAALAKRAKRRKARQAQKKLDRDAQRRKDKLTIARAQSISDRNKIRDMEIKIRETDDPQKKRAIQDKIRKIKERIRKREQKFQESVDGRTKPFKEKVKKLNYEKKTITEKEIKGLRKKADKSGMPYGILKQVYNRGMAAWKTGHRPGTTPQQWAMARVNSFVTKSSGTWGKADKDLAAKVRARKK